MILRVDFFLLPRSWGESGVFAAVVLVAALLSNVASPDNLVVSVAAVVTAAAVTVAILWSAEKCATRRAEHSME